MGNKNDTEIDDAFLIQEAHLKRERDTGQKEFKFEIGKIATTGSVIDRMEKTRKQLKENDKTEHGSFTGFIEGSFARHCLCDWGEVSQEEKKANDKSIDDGGQLLSTYSHTIYPTICILTEADRSETSIGFLTDFE